MLNTFSLQRIHACYGPQARPIWIGEYFVPGAGWLRFDGLTLLVVPLAEQFDRVIEAGATMVNLRIEISDKEDRRADFSIAELFPPAMPNPSAP